MNHSEAIAGLGINAGLHLLDFLELDKTNDQMAGSEFTYIGLFLSAFCYKEKVNSAIDLMSLCLSSIESIHSKLNCSDAAKATVLAENALHGYCCAVHSWPSKEIREQVAIALCELLADRLQQFAGVNLTIFQKAKLRPKIAEQFEVLEIAYSEMRSRKLFEGCNPSNYATSECKTSSVTRNSEVSNLCLAEIAKAKENLLADFDDGEITGLEYHRGLDNLIRQEIILHVAAAEIRVQKSSRWNMRNIVFALGAAFFLGFLIGPWLYPKIFGYSSAEECVLNTKHKYAVGACYDLYPSIQK